MRVHATAVVAGFQVQHTDTAVAGFKVQHADTAVAGFKVQHADTAVAGLKVQLADTAVAGFKAQHTDTAVVGFKVKHGARGGCHGGDDWVRPSEVGLDGGRHVDWGAHSAQDGGLDSETGVERHKACC